MRVHHGLMIHPHFCIYSSGLSVLHLGLKLVSEVINAYIFVHVDFLSSSYGRD